MRRSLIFRLLMVVFLVAAVGLSTLVWLGRDSNQKLGPQPGDPAPDLVLTDTAGKTIRLADLRKGEGRDGRLAVISFWSPTCPTGKGHLAGYAALADWCRTNDVDFFAVDSYGDSTEKAAALAKEHGCTYPVYMDEATTVARQFGARMVTATYLLDREGRIRYRGALDNGGSGADLVLPAAIAARELAQGKEVSCPKVAPFG